MPVTDHIRTWFTRRAARTLPIADHGADWDTAAGIAYTAPWSQSPAWSGSLISASGRDWTTAPAAATVQWTYGTSIFHPSATPAKFIDLTLAHSLARYSRIYVHIDVVGNNRLRHDIHPMLWFERARANTLPWLAKKYGAASAYARLMAAMQCIEQHMTVRLTTSTGTELATDGANGRAARAMGAIGYRGETIGKDAKVLTPPANAGDKLTSGQVLSDAQAVNFYRSYAAAETSWARRALAPPQAETDEDYAYSYRPSHKDTWLCTGCNALREVCAAERIDTATMMAQAWEADPGTAAIAAPGLGPIVPPADLSATGH